MCDMLCLRSSIISFLILICSFNITILCWYVGFVFAVSLVLTCVSKLCCFIYQYVAKLVFKKPSSEIPHVTKCCLFWFWGIKCVFVSPTWYLPRYYLISHISFFSFAAFAHLLCSSTHAFLNLCVFAHRYQFAKLRIDYSLSFYYFLYIVQISISYMTSISHMWRIETYYFYDTSLNFRPHTHCDNSVRFHNDVVYPVV